MTAGHSPGVDAVLDRMRQTLGPLEAGSDSGRYFLATYSRTTKAVGEAIGAALFEDPEWVDAWDVAFAQLYLDALDAHRADPCCSGSTPTSTTTCRRPCWP
jgi:Family of unknown function (DUF5995)